MKSLIIRFLAITAILSCATEQSHAFYRAGTSDHSPSYDPTRLIVKLKNDLSPMFSSNAEGVVQTGIGDFDAVNREYAIKKQSLLFPKRAEPQPGGLLTNIYILTVNEGGDLDQMREDYEALESVVYAELDYYVELYDSPDDPLYQHQWALNNTGQGYYHVLRHDAQCDDDELVIEYGTPDADIDAEEVFQDPPDNTSTVIVAIVDTGVDLDHPDLAARIWVNPGETPDNGVDDDRNGYVDDINGWDFAGDGIELPPDNDVTDTHGHGTHCSGIVTAIANNATGVAGISDDCKIMGLKFYPWMMSSWAAEAIVYAADNGADVINMSWGLPFTVQVWEDALVYARAKGVVLVAAAGNDGVENINFPAGYDNTMAVSATSSDDEITHFSTYGSNINVCAPGYSILSLRADTTDMYGPCEDSVHVIDDQYYLASGTSMSAPHVAAIAAYLRAVSPGITHDKTKEIIEQTSHDLVDPFGLGWDYPGWDIYSGHGRVNLYSALQSAPSIRAKIDSPRPNELVYGSTDITGIADGAEFSSFNLEYGTGHTPSSWTEITTSSTPVTDGILGSWNTFGLTGIYTIRLRVGEFNEDYATVYLTNETVVEISTPAEGDTVTSYVQVTGSAICPDFEKLTLEYGRGTSPSSWSQICELTTPAFNSNIFAWATDVLSNGYYTLRLSAHSTGGIEGSDSVVLYVRSPFSEPDGWRISLGPTLTIIANYGDFDSDGALEIVVGTSSGISFFNPDGTPKTTGVPSTPDYDFTVPIPVGNLDGDGVDDFVAVSVSPARLYGFPSTAPSFDVALPEAPYVSGYNYTEEYAYPFLFLKDIDNDGLDEIHYSIGGYFDVNYYIFNPDGTPWDYGFPIYTSYNNSYLPADLDGDSVCEIYCTAPSTVIELDLTGNVINSYDIEGPSGWTTRPMSAVDIDDDGKCELIVPGYFGNNPGNYSNYLIYAFDEGLAPVPGWPHDTGIGGYYVLRPPVFGDLNGDGVIEYVSSFWDIYTSFVHVWNLDGSPFVGDSTQNGFFAPSPDPSTLHITILADLDGDVHPEIVISQTPAAISPYDKQSIAAWQSDAQFLPGWPITVDFDVTTFPTVRTNTPVIGDLDGDGNIDLFMTTIYNDLVFVNFPEYGYTPAAAPCPYWRYNRSMNNTYFPLHGLCGDADGSGKIDIDDVVHLVMYVFAGGPPPVTEVGGDPDCSDSIDIDDAIYLISFIFSGGSSPCADCPSK